MTGSVALIVRRTVRAPVARVFDAWTNPEHLRAWWGPRPATCSGAEVDLRVGGRYRIDNALPDGKTVVIHGEFREIVRPRKLVYTWTMGLDAHDASLVTVRFEDRDGATEVVVLHENVATEAARKSHEDGWQGCLDGLERFFVTPHR